MSEDYRNEVPGFQRPTATRSRTLKLVGLLGPPHSTAASAVVARIVTCVRDGILIRDVGVAYLAGGSTFNGEDGERYLGERTRGIVADVADLQRHSLGIAPDDKPVPAVTGIDSYITERVNDQIDRYYRPKAAGYVQRVKRLRTVGDLLTVISVVFAAVAAFFEIKGLAARVSVVTSGDLGGRLHGSRPLHPHDRRVPVHRPASGAATRLAGRHPNRQRGVR